MFGPDYCPCESPDLWKEEEDEDKYFPETQWLGGSFNETYRDESGSETNISDDTNNSSQNDDFDTPSPPKKIPQSTNNLVDKSSNSRSINKVSKIHEKSNPVNDPPVPSVGVDNVKKNKIYIVDESSDCDSEPENSNVKSLGVKIPQNRDGHVRSSEPIFPAAKPSNSNIKSLIKPGSHQRVMGFEVTPDALPDSSDSDDNIKSTPTKKTVAFSFSFSKNKENLKSDFDEDIYSSAEVKNWLESHGKSQSRWIISHDQSKKRRFEKWEDYCLLYYIIKDKLVNKWNSQKVWEEMKYRYNYLPHRSAKSIVKRFDSYIVPQIKSYGLPESIQEEMKNIIRKKRPW
ncbi:uncharacterized protein LOC130669904 [Microplitis mediator]|uniref:uncharacterized protein LOC130669904 n=1 Tax=Microplitis mediator TaxID=375433 RepID=UPI0025532769|nr:uncharacterized protein LOC130669904 [Microplitis mediator]